jgi:alpha-beta hydrolase superfamily lysophospholipase
MSLLPRSRALVVAVAAVALAAALPAASPAAKTAPKPPAGLAFYTAPASLVAGTHGSVIWSRGIRGTVKLPSSARSTLVLYRSRGLDGKAITVSGTVDVPRGKAPKGGWPIVSYAHGTTGIADVCAPSRDSASSPVHDYVVYANPVLDTWIKRGYAVARTDYQGLGTPGTHPYLVGHSEGRGVLDIVRAARELDPSIGKRLAIAGHSQGGQSALFAAADAPAWTPELNLRGVAAYAPASHITLLVKGAAALTQPNSLSGLGGMLVSGAGSSSPPVDVAKLMTPEANALFPQTRRLCLPQLSKPTSWGALAPANIIRSDVDTTALYKATDAMNPALKIKAPVLLLQGSADTTVSQGLTDELKPELVAKGDAVDYRIYPGVDHGGIVKAANTRALAWLKLRLG